MGRLVYSMMVSADGYTEDETGSFGWGAVDEELHSFVTARYRSVGTFLYGRRMYETMVYWETAHRDPTQSPSVHAYARQWQSCAKIVYSTSLGAPRSARTTIRRSFEPAEVRRLKAELPHDLSVDGPTLAGQALEAGLVDEVHLLVTPALAGGGRRFFPAGVRGGLELLEERRFPHGTVFLGYRVAG